MAKKPNAKQKNRQKMISKRNAGIVRKAKILEAKSKRKK